MNTAMIDPQLLVTFTVSVAVIVAVPGPSVLFIVGRALSVGRPAALAAAAGDSLGAAVQGVLGVLGLGTVIGGSPVAHGVIKAVGAVYLVLLGASTLRGRGSATGASAPTSGAGGRHLRQGFVVGVSNPKSLVFLAAALPQFIDPARGRVVVQMLVLLVVYTALCLVGNAAWGFAGGLLRNWTATSPRRIEATTGLGGACIIVLGLVLALPH